MWNQSIKGIQSPGKPSVMSGECLENLRHRT